MSGRRHRHRGWRSSKRSSSTSLTVVAASGSAGASPLQFSWARLALWLTGAGCSAPTPAWCCRLGSVAEAAWQQRRARLSRLKQCCASGAMLSHPPHRAAPVHVIRTPCLLCRPLLTHRFPSIRSLSPPALRILHRRYCKHEDTSSTAATTPAMPLPLAVSVPSDDSPKSSDRAIVS